MGIFDLGRVPVGPLPDGRGITKHTFVHWEAHFAAHTHGPDVVARLVTPAKTLPPAEKLIDGVRFFRHRVEMDTKRVYYWRER